MKNKKGQAAMEFLMTYGWAILAAIIAIGVLAYFGVFDKDRYAPDDFTPPESNSHCEKIEITEVSLGPREMQRIPGKVIDYYVTEKEPSKYYWDKICNDLAGDELLEQLNKSKNLRLDVFSQGVFSLEYKQDFICRYEVRWTGEKDSWGTKVEEGLIDFTGSELRLAREERPPIYSESLISVEPLDDYEETRLENSNSDYSLMLKLKFSEPTEVCK